MLVVKLLDFFIIRFPGGLAVRIRLSLFIIRSLLPHCIICQVSKGFGEMPKTMAWSIRKVVDNHSFSCLPENIYPNKAALPKLGRKYAGRAKQNKSLW